MNNNTPNFLKDINNVDNVKNVDNQNTCNNAPDKSILGKSELFPEKLNTFEIQKIKTEIDKNKKRQEQIDREDNNNRIRVELINKIRNIMLDPSNINDNFYKMTFVNGYYGCYSVLENDFRNILTIILDDLKNLNWISLIISDENCSNYNIPNDGNFNYDIYIINNNIKNKIIKFKCRNTPDNILELEQKKKEFLSYNIHINFETSVTLPFFKQFSAYINGTIIGRNK